MRKYFIQIPSKGIIWHVTEDLKKVKLLKHDAIPSLLKIYNHWRDIDDVNSFWFSYKFEKYYEKNPRKFLSPDYYKILTKQEAFIEML